MSDINYKASLSQLLSYFLHSRTVLIIKYFPGTDQNLQQFIFISTIYFFDKTLDQNAEWNSPSI
jgi:hypothetical protein